ncbi:sugar ABC transporter substrate-binding protein [Neobacillus rhizosphaerae]|uniref:ABC transporter substrate-binding protein n=1 Tax=Neobacillus rhizosphaerae TaxID=2880965 RepID=UPI003D2E5EE4
MLRKKVTTSMLAITMAASLALTGCHGKEQSSQKSSQKTEQIVHLTFWDDNSGPQRTPIWKEIIDKFEKENPTIDIKYVGLPKDSAKATFDAAIAAEDTPDIGSVYTSWLPEYSSRHALLPLDSYFANWSEKEKINKEAIRFNQQIVVDQKLYGIPYTENLDILWVRSDWLNEAHMKAPETWDEFFRAAEKLTDPAKKRYGFTIRGGAGASFQLQRMMYAYSGIEDSIINGKSTINNPKHVEFLKKYLALYQNYTPKSDITNDYKAMLAGFDTGVAAMVQHNLGSYAEHSEVLTPDQFQAVPLPKSVKGHFTVEAGNAIGISIFKGTKHPKEAWKFVQFMNSKFAQSYWNRNVGQIPTNADVLNEEWVKNAPHIQIAAKVYSNPETTLNEPPFYLPEYSRILYTIVDPSIQAVLSGNMTVEELLEQWAGAINEAQQQYDQQHK